MRSLSNLWHFICFRKGVKISYIMRVLMISLDRGLLGGGFSGDAVERHKKYADLVGSLDIIVLAKPVFQHKIFGLNLRVFSTKSQEVLHYRRALEMGKKLFDKHPYDLLITQEFAAPVGAMLKKKFKIPWIVNVHSMFFSLGWLKISIFHWYLFFRIRRAIRLADGFRVNNVVIKNKLLDWKIKKPILVQPTPIDVRRFAFSEKPWNKTLKILFVGRLEPEKNLLMLIHAIKKIKEDLSLKIVGSGSQEKRLRKLAKEDSRIKFFGPKTLEELPEFFREADIFVLPSNTESFGQVLIQAGVAACAIVATKTPGAMSILENSVNALLIEIGDEKGLQEEIYKLLTDQKLRHRLATEARKLLIKFDSETGIMNTVNFWKEIAKK